MSYVKKIKKSSRQKQKTDIIKVNMPSRYRFDVIFNVNLTLGIIIPRFTVIINNTRFSTGVAINRYTSFGGLNLFNYIGKDIIGVWSSANGGELTITGFE